MKDYYKAYDERYKRVHEKNYYGSLVTLLKK